MHQAPQSSIPWKWILPISWVRLDADCPLQPAGKRPAWITPCFQIWDPKRRSQPKPPRLLTDGTVRLSTDVVWRCWIYAKCCGTNEVNTESKQIKGGWSLLTLMVFLLPYRDLEIDTHSILLDLSTQPSSPNLHWHPARLVSMSSSPCTCLPYTLPPSPRPTPVAQCLQSKRDVGISKFSCYLVSLHPGAD